MKHFFVHLPEFGTKTNIAVFRYSIFMCGWEVPGGPRPYARILNCKNTGTLKSARCGEDYNGFCGKHFAEKILYQAPCIYMYFRNWRNVLHQCTYISIRKKLTGFLVKQMKHEKALKIFNESNHPRGCTSIETKLAKNSVICSTPRPLGLHGKRSKCDLPLPKNICEILRNFVFFFQLTRPLTWISSLKVQYWSRYLVKNLKK